MHQDADAELRQQLISLLDGGNAHIRFKDAFEGFPFELTGERPGGSPHSVWQLVEHIRIAQHDILAFSGGTDEPYKHLKWPDEYWPENAAPRNRQEWTLSTEAIRRDLEAFRKLIRDPGRDLHARLPGGEGQTLLREALLIADHTSYHLGQIMLLRRMLEQS